MWLDSEITDGVLPNDTGFQVGDRVQLNSGGPMMTVAGITGLNVRDRVECTWVDGKKKAHGYFSPPMLTKR